MSMNAKFTEESLKTSSNIANAFTIIFKLYVLLNIGNRAKERNVGYLIEDEGKTKESESEDEEIEGDDEEIESYEEDYDNNDDGNNNSDTNKPCALLWKNSDFIKTMEAIVEAENQGFIPEQNLIEAIAC
ncbi:9963_t:CDS:2 [Ambispora gerdemannii]|uniref:9963_t:CDS:1 n=1 Tax=Ambispora gerdemannii TaxID=144530 RepID=A0A9N8VQF4_9GLOM|nr:9963_t:CDS:2 [Ambispora gerdemannii]